MPALRTIVGICALALALAVSPARAILLYATDETNQGLYTIDTGAAYAVSLVGTYTIPGEEFFIGGLAFDSHGVLYGVSATDFARLYTLDPHTAATTLVGPLYAGFVFEGGLAFEPGTGTLYGANLESSGAPHLMKIDAASGAGTDLGLIAGGEHDFGGLAFDALGQLFGLDRSTNALWRIDKANPASALTVQVGAGLGSGIVMGRVGGMTDDPATGTFYGYAEGSRHLFTVNLATGAGTVLHQFAANDPVFYSLAYPGEVPTASRPETWGALKARYRR
jgi:hypothetical protein